MILTTSEAPALILQNQSILKSKCYKYAEDVASGMIVASKKNIQASRRFIRDLEQMGQKDYPWIFDIEKAYHPIEFIERFMKPTKGSYRKMTLLPWQHFVEANLYGWISKKTGYRRFREGLIIVGRGNGKTTLISGNGAYGISKDGENGAEVYVLANSKEQSGILYDEVKNNIQGSLILSKHFRATTRGIYYDKTNSKLQHRASDSKRLDGLNTHLGIFDEIHEFRDWKLISVIKRSMNKRRQPLIIYITTLGTQLDGPLMELYQIASDVLNDTGAIKQSVADRIFCYIAEIDETDNPDDSEKWIKANPSIGAMLDLEDLKNDWERAKLVPEERADFITKQLNVFGQIDKMSMLDIPTIKKNNRVIDTDILLGRRCYGGFDLSATEDFTSACLEFPLDAGAFFVLSHSWTTRKKVKLDNEKLDYETLQKEGHLTIVNENFINIEHVFWWFMEQSKKYEIFTIGYDPANAPFLVNKLQNEGFGLNMVRQGAITLNAPLKDLKERFLDGKIIHNNNPMYNWYLSNVKLTKDNKENWLPTKQDKFRKIDGFAAHLDAHTEWMRNNPIQGEEPENVVTVINLQERR
jgi:phage terminase large subunit-like protein